MANSPAVDRLLDNLRINLPGAVDSTILLELYNTLKDFCKWSKAWQAVVPIQVQPGCRVYLFATVAGKPEYLLGVIPKKDMAVDGTDPPSEISPGGPGRVNAVMPEPGKLVLQYEPNEEQEFCVNVSLNVTDPVLRTGLPIFPDWIIEQYDEALKEGTLSRMMFQASKPYTSLQGATYHGVSYRKLRNEARNSINTGNVYGGQRWMFPQTFNRRRY